MNPGAWEDWFSERMAEAFANATVQRAAQWIIFATRFILPLAAVVIIIRCARSLLSGANEKEVWGALVLPNGARIELTHWENIIGRAASSDVILEYPTLSRSHAALTRDADGNWTIFDIGSKHGLKVNGRKADGPCGVRTGSVISLGGVDLVFMQSSISQEREQAADRERPGGEIGPTLTLALLTEYILFLAIAICCSKGSELTLDVPIAFVVLIAVMWLCYILTRALGRVGFEIETIAFLLTATGFGVVASSDPGALLKTTICLIGGVALFWGLGWFLRDLDRARRLRVPIAGAGLLLLAVNLVTAESIFGAKNWLSIGSVSFQPSEFVKICFVFAGAATLDKLFTKRNLVLFVGFAAACVGCLVMMSDFGTALVFFTAYLVIAFMRSGSFATVLLSGAGAGFAAFIAVTAKPYIADRFSTWGHAWEQMNDGGYQQTRTMASAASGGLFGLGAGNGWVKNVFAADTDMVFGMVCEELGLIVALTMVAGLIVAALFVVKSAAGARSAFYAIASCAAVSILLMQVILNVFGSLDILPFTGVTFPFVSKGGSSLMASWGLLSFVKAADTRQNGSFTVRLPKRREREV